MEPDNHYLVKRGFYYRPNSCGYTPLREEAGLYPKSRENKEDGITAIDKREAPLISPGCSHSVRQDSMIMLLRRQIDSLGVKPIV